MIFDIKLDTRFTQKERSVAYRQKVDTPSYMTYTSILLRYGVRIVLMLASLNVLCVKCDEVQNAYLDTIPKERVWFWDGQEFSIHKIKVFFSQEIVWFKGRGISLGIRSQKKIKYLGFNLYKYYKDLWMRKAVDTSNIGATTEDSLPPGEFYYEYILIHADDLMVARHRSDQVM